MRSGRFKVCGSDSDGSGERPMACDGSPRLHDLVTPMSIGPIRPFTVAPSIPPGLRPLTELAYNLRWSWHRDTAALFERNRVGSVGATRHNPPVARAREPGHLDRAPPGHRVLSHLDRVRESLARYLARPPIGAGAARAARRVLLRGGRGSPTACRRIRAGSRPRRGPPKSPPTSASRSRESRCSTTRASPCRSSRRHGCSRRATLPRPFRLPIQLCLQPSGEPSGLGADARRPGPIRCGRRRSAACRLYLLDTNSTGTPSRCACHVAPLRRRPRVADPAEIVLGIGGIRALEALARGDHVPHERRPFGFLGLERIRLLMEREI